MGSAQGVSGFKGRDRILARRTRMCFSLCGEHEVITFLFGGWEGRGTLMGFARVSSGVERLDEGR